MAKHLHEILSTPTIQPTLELVIIKKCGNPHCKEIISTHDGFEYIHSKANDNFYCDAVCLANAEEIEIDWLDADKSKLNWMLNEWECELRG